MVGKYKLEHDLTFLKYVWALFKILPKPFCHNIHVLHNIQKTPIVKRVTFHLLHGIRTAASKKKFNLFLLLPVTNLSVVCLSLLLTVLSLLLLLFLLSKKTKKKKMTKSQKKISFLFLFPRTDTLKESFLSPLFFLCR